MVDIVLREFRVSDGERQLSQLCLRVVLFGSPVEGGEGLASPFDAFVSRFGEMLGWYRDGFHQALPKRFPKERANDVFERMRREIVSSKGAAVEMLAPSKKNEWVAPAFLHWKSGGESAPFCMISLPLAWFDAEGVHGIETLLHEVIDGGFPLTTGYVGLSVLWNHSRPSDKMRLTPVFREWLSRYPGLMHPSPLMQIEYANKGIVDVGWFTLIGPMLADQAGGSDTIESRIPANVKNAIKIDRFANGALVIRAGAAPALVDCGGGSVPLLAQHAVGVALAMLCDLERNGKQSVPGFYVTDEANERWSWANRFFVQQMK